MQPILRIAGIGVIGLAIAMALPSVSHATVLWRGDFETGDISQWTRAQEVSSDRLQAVEAPVRQGHYALRAEVQQGDNPIAASGNRNELVRMTNESEGDERYYGWSTYWPSDFPFTPTWQVVTQWHHSGPNGAPPVRFVLGCSAADCGEPLPDTLFFIVTGQNLWTKAHITRGVWHDFALHVKWSSNPSVGFVELWYDGEKVVPKTYADTLFPGETNYLKQGLYRDAATQPTQVIFHDGFVIATTLDEVMNGQSEPPDAGDVEPPPEDAGGCSPDAAAPEVDAAIPVEPDAGAEIDAGGELADAAFSDLDAGSDTVVDAAFEVIDAGFDSSADSGSSSAHADAGLSGELHSTCGYSSSGLRLGWLAALAGLISLRVRRKAVARKVRI